MDHGESSSDRKRTRFCHHCKEDVTYLVYKRHRDEFYDARLKKWRTIDGRGAEVEDAEDDVIICNAVSHTHQGI